MHRPRQRTRDNPRDGRISERLAGHCGLVSTELVESRIQLALYDAWMSNVAYPGRSRSSRRDAQAVGAAP